MGMAQRSAFVNRSQTGGRCEFSVCLLKEGFFGSLTQVRIYLSHFIAVFFGANVYFLMLEVSGHKIAYPKIHKSSVSVFHLKEKLYLFIKVSFLTSELSL